MKWLVPVVIRERAEFDHGATLAQAASCFHGRDADGTVPTLERGEVFLASREFDRRRLVAPRLDGKTGRRAALYALDPVLICRKSGAMGASEGDSQNIDMALT